MEGKIISGKILIKPIIKTKTESGIILPDKKEDSISDGIPPKGEVIMVGKELNFPLEASVGDIVYCRRYDPFFLEDGGELLGLVNIGDIMFIKENAKINLEKLN